MSENIARLGHQIDEAADHGDRGALVKALARCEAALGNATDEERAQLHYLTANAHAGMRQIKLKDQDYAWCWEQPEAIGEILALRKAVNEPSFSGLDAVRRCQILTNLGNSLDHIGRTIEAIEHWDAAIEINPKFAMSLGNRGRGLLYYCGLLYDTGHQGVFLCEAHADLTAALSDDAFWECEYPPEVADSIRGNLTHIEKFINVSDAQQILNKDDWLLGKSEKEIAYRQWRLEHRLFLNPLNDLGAWPIAARDIFHLPEHTYAINEPPRFAQYYDLLKEEYVAACAFLFEAGYDGLPEYADEEILLFDHFDYPASGLRVQKLKTSFRTAYSILDKVAIFINDYFHLCRKPRSVSFRNIWCNPKKKKEKAPSLVSDLANRKNRALRGLFALSQDLIEDGFKKTAAPDARMLVDLRNAAEHRFLSLHDFGENLTSNETIQRITVDEFSAKTLRMLKVARSALIYLSWAVAIEERQKLHNEDQKHSLSSIPMSAVPRQFP